MSFCKNFKIIKLVSDIEILQNLFSGVERCAVLDRPDEEARRVWPECGGLQGHHHHQAQQGLPVPHHHQGGNHGE